VFTTLTTGITPDGKPLSRIPVQGGTQGRFANCLSTGFMPRGGRHWDDDELNILYEWLLQYKK